MDPETSTKTKTPSDLRIRPNKSLLYKFEGKECDKLKVKSILIAKGLSIINKQGCVLLTNNQNNNVKINKFFKKVEKLGVKVTKVNKTTKGLNMKRIVGNPKRLPCNWIIIGDEGTETTAFKNESECEDEMLNKEVQLQFLNKKLYRTCSQALHKRGMIRIAQDIPNAGASKQYWIAICISHHPGELYCDEIDLVNKIEAENHNQYEVVRDEPRRHYFDIEWMSDDNSDESKLTIILNLFARFYKDVYESDIDQTMYITKGSRPKNGRHKHSFHVIYKNVTFNNNAQHNTYMKAFKSWIGHQPEADEIAEIATHKFMTKAIYGYAYDGAVYTKNRLMRLPGQTKPESNCTPFSTYNVNGFPCLTEPILISGRFAQGANRVPTDDIKIVSLSEEKKLAPKHDNHLDSILTPYKEEQAKRRKMEKTQKREDLCKTSKRWYKIKATKLRHKDFMEFMRYAAAVINVFNPPEEEVLEWMDHERAEEWYAYLKKKTQEDKYSKYNWQLLLSYNVIVDVKEHVNNAMNLIFNKPKKLLNILPNKSALEAPMPEIEKVSDLNIELENKMCVDMISGKMGVGKTCKIIKIISSLPMGRLVLYIVGRIRLAEEIVNKFMNLGNEKLDVRRQYNEKNRENCITVDVAVINSLKKYKGRYDLLVIDETVTTINNMEMEKFDTKGICNDLYCKIINPSTKVIALDAMFTVPIVMLIRAWCLGMSSIENSSDDQDSDNEREMIVSNKTIKFTELCGEISTRNIIPLCNDESNIQNYFDLKNTSPNVPNVNNSTNLEGFVKKLLQKVICEEKNVVIVVPTKEWIRKIVKLFAEKKQVLAITREAKVNFHKIDFSNYNVVTYTSTISAGHSITLGGHFDSVFLMCGGVDFNGEWKTAAVDEMIQMTARLRNPVSKNIYIAVDVRSKKRNTKMSSKSSYSIDFDNFAYSLYKNALFAIGRALTLLSCDEYLEFVCDWLKNKAYPGSQLVKEDEQVSHNDLIAIVQQYTTKPVIVNSEDQECMYNIIRTLTTNWYRFVEMKTINGKGKIIKLVRKRVTLETINKYAGSTAKYVSLGEDYYNLLSV